MGVREVLFYRSIDMAFRGRQRKISREVGVGVAAVRTHGSSYLAPLRDATVAEELVTAGREDSLCVRRDGVADLSRSQWFNSVD